jgi:hypothetical protein
MAIPPKMNHIPATYKGKTFLIHGWLDSAKTTVYGVDDAGNPFRFARAKFPRVPTASITKITSINKKTVKKADPSIPAQEFAQSFTYGIPELASEIQGCVYKLFFGTKFIIVKAKYLRNSLEILQRNYAYFYANKHLSTDNKNLLYFKFYEHCRTNHDKLKYRVELAVQSNGPLELLIAEQDLLLAEMKNKKCLNTSLVAYFPKWVPSEVKTKFVEIYKDTIKL